MRRAHAKNALAQGDAKGAMYSQVQRLDLISSWQQWCRMFRKSDRQSRQLEEGWSLWGRRAAETLRHALDP
jgi:hypothetical protein